MKLPDPPPLHPAPAMSLDQFYEGERAVSIRACENYAKLYAKEYGEAVREACARVCDAELALWVAEVGEKPDGLTSSNNVNIVLTRSAAAIRKKEE